MTSQVIDGGLVMGAVRVSEAAAIAAWAMSGLGDEKAADHAAADAMRTALNELDIDGSIVIGEGELDEAPMLYVGETVGRRRGPRIDIALDPLVGASLTAKAIANAMAVMAWAPAGALLATPDMYMDKIACGPGLAQGLLDLDRSPGRNAEILAAAKGVKISDITVCVLDRPRHAGIIASLRAVGARVALIADGDITGVVNIADAGTGIDMYMGQGGAREGVLACAALKCVGGQFQGRLLFRNPDDRARAHRYGIADLERKYDLHELVRTDALFVATGVTNGALLDGVRVQGGIVGTHTLVMNSATRTVRHIRMKRPL